MFKLIVFIYICIYEYNILTQDLYKQGLLDMYFSLSQDIMSGLQPPPPLNTKYFLTFHQQPSERHVFKHKSFTLVL